MIKFIEIEQKNGEKIAIAVNSIEFIAEQNGTTIYHDNGVATKINMQYTESVDQLKQAGLLISLEEKNEVKQNKENGNNFITEWHWLANEKPPCKDEIYTVLSKYGVIEKVLFGCSGAMGESYSFFNGKTVKSNDIIAYQ